MTEEIKDKYTWVTNDKDETQYVGLTPKAGTFQGVIYKYTKVSIPNPEEMEGKSDLPLRFEYDIVDSNNLPEEWFAEQFNNLAGDILVDILEDQVREGKVQFANLISED